MLDCGFKQNRSTFLTLEKTYGEKHRFYHTFQHIEACLDHLDSFLTQQECPHPHLVALSLWFHDAIYRWHKKDNELQSALWCKQFMIIENADTKDIELVFKLIMSTAQHNATQNFFQQLIIDIDLSILGQEPEIYKNFEIAIRKEYKFIPSFIFNKKRKKLLSDFLKRERIYNLDFFHLLLEDQARKNLHSAILSL